MTCHMLAVPSLDDVALQNTRLLTCPSWQYIADMDKFSFGSHLQTHGTLFGAFLCTRKGRRRIEIVQGCRWLRVTFTWPVIKPFRYAGPQPFRLFFCFGHQCLELSFLLNFGNQLLLGLLPFGCNSDSLHLKVLQLGQGSLNIFDLRLRLIGLFLLLMTRRLLDFMVFFDGGHLLRLSIRCFWYQRIIGPQSLEAKGFVGQSNGTSL
mmetsp:Transcript_45288/g.76354  ORF Transcript_45288/g.76354 Transcript_45288/m.76354 type:complete len:207 (-) Transcript_45288:221-841(-)